MVSEDGKERDILREPLATPKPGNDGKDSEDGVIKQPEESILGVPLSEFIRQRVHKPRGRSIFEG